MWLDLYSSFRKGFFKMKRIKKKDIETNININITDADTYVIVYNEKDWEGGRISEMPLKTKAEFYHVASQLSNVLFDIFDFYREEDICIGPFFELSNYCRRKDVNAFNLVQELKVQIKPKNYYWANSKEDKELIEKLIEENMRYLTQACFYLPAKQILLQVGHHTAFIAYSKDLEALNNEFADIVKNYSGWHCEPTSFYGKLE